MVPGSVHPSSSASSPRSRAHADSSAAARHASVSSRGGGECRECRAMAASASSIAARASAAVPVASVLARARVSSRPCSAGTYSVDDSDDSTHADDSRKDRSARSSRGSGTASYARTAAASIDANSDALVTDVLRASAAATDAAARAFSSFADSAHSAAFRRDAFTAVSSPPLSDSSVHASDASAQALAWVRATGRRRLHSPRLSSVTALSSAGIFSSVFNAVEQRAWSPLTSDASAMPCHAAGWSSLMSVARR